MNWFAAELHNHTFHSDGKFTTEELCEAAKDWGVDVIALTDHNTKAPLAELSPELEARTVPVIRGIEWTTFFGHLCVLGEHCDVDWRDATPQNIEEKVRLIKAQNGLAGIAHPFVVGSPMCTGCHWNFDLQDFSGIDYMEIWSGEFPSVQTFNRRSLAFWTQLLDAGWRIAASYGRDWHGPQPTDAARAVTYLGVPEDTITAESAFEAIRAGRTAITLGPLLTISLEDGKGPGDTATRGHHTLQIKVDLDVRRKHWEFFHHIPEKLVILGEGNQVLDEFMLSDTGYQTTRELNIQGKYLRAELHGTTLGTPCTLALTSPIYFQD